MVSVPLSILGVSVLGASCFAAKNVKEKRKEKHNGGPSASANESIPNFEYEELESATNYFDQSNKLGLGESGSAYKAVLSDGTTVAIKRLSNNPMQSMDAVLKDVDLISGIQHPNLVQLLGYSIKGSEILLVYEYVPNESLDHFLGIANKPILSWDMRKNIIVGTAKGLAYLHQESIIHGDIKQRNILLDENFTAKVADFGLARFFQEGGTRVGTADGRNLGYLAPERHIRGNSTEKADIYSFGMLIIDIVTGKGTAPFLRNVGCSLQTFITKGELSCQIWSFYLSDNLAECVDPKLRGKFPKRDALRVLNIGLVCAQASDELRPPMSKVVKMLTDGNCAIPPPPHPAPFDL
ncbi:cysteine-rich receptor-like protein kinase 3 [Nymphaea colorata]|nr:cysteine-rich receptor-like protein kinase 3 [Nymphaea colorata]